ncbi:MAG TPA: response regulator transcription factor [Longimicrobiaceae bacterium]|nr:response regulator transcription factor [Longimicrobiaceae bacterium]
MAIRALIVEDEPLARQTLREFSRELSWIEVIGEAEDGRSAVQMIDSLQPDLVFLDIQMPELSGLQVVEKIQHEPAIIFTTAFDRHAVSAFELEALDYLLKPFGRERFRIAAERARQRLGQSVDVPSLRERLSEAEAKRSSPLSRIFVRHGSGIVPIQIAEVTRFEASGDYVRVFVGGNNYLIEISLSDLEHRLDPVRFRRVHRSHVVNIEHVASMRPYDSRRLLIRMRDGSEVVASRSGSQQLRDLIF